MSVTTIGTNDPQRAAEWERVFGRRWLPVRIVQRASAPGVEAATFCILDDREFSDDQVRAIATWVSARWCIPIDEIISDIRAEQHGLPIIDKGDLFYVTSSRVAAQ